MQIMSVYVIFFFNESTVWNLKATIFIVFQYFLIHIVNFQTYVMVSFYQHWLEVLKKNCTYEIIKDSNLDKPFSYKIFEYAMLE